MHARVCERKLSTDESQFLPNSSAGSSAKQCVVAYLCLLHTLLPIDCGARNGWERGGGEGRGCEGGPRGVKGNWGIVSTLCGGRAICCTRVHISISPEMASVLGF